MTEQTNNETKQMSPAEKQQEEEKVLNQRMQDIGYKLLVLSGKGGVGKSTVAANLAVSLAEAGHKVGLLDVDIHGPSIPRMLGVQGRRLESVGDTLIPLRVNENLQVISIEFLLSDGQAPVIWRGPLKFKMIRQFLKDVAWGKLDYLVVDSPPGTGDEPLAVAQMVGSPSSAVIVTTPQNVAISDVRRCVSFCQSLSLPVAGILENMSGFVCPGCGEKVDLFKSGGGEALATDMQVPFLGKIPFDPRIVSSGDDGLPFVGINAESAAATVFAGVVEKLKGLNNIES
jgi:ATP-binding protein involved in chromosome partitioning